MFSLLGIGIVLIVTNYFGMLPGGASNTFLLIGIIEVTGGFIVATMLRSIPSLANVILLLGLIIYVYAVIGVHLFGATDPAHWGGLPRAGLTLFQILTLEGWVELQQASLAATPWAWVTSICAAPSSIYSLHPTTLE